MVDIVSLLESPSGIGGLSVGMVILIFIVYMYLLERKKENQERFDFTKYDYGVDASDTVSGKIALVENCTKVGTPIISSMGTGNKIKIQ